MNFQYIPIWANECPAFIACMLAMGAIIIPMRNHHGSYSVLMSWGNETDKFRSLENGK